MNASRLLATCMMFTAAITCALADDKKEKSDYAKQIIGKWEGDGGTLTVKKAGEKEKVYVRKAVIEFRADGTFTVTIGDLPELKESMPNTWKGGSQTGKYSFVTDMQIEVAMKVDSKEEKMRSMVSVAKDELTITEKRDDKKKEQPMKYNRVKKE